MFWMWVAAAFLALWVAGMITGYTGHGAVYIFLVIAILLLAAGGDSWWSGKVIARRSKEESPPQP
ncbi:TPA: hypothetical protein DEQ22_00810 [Candidatus Nomurabacteria bacterium]|uniref:Lmo0937 family membrane protein n=1 Tax=Candidatus Nomurabacteria bacterium RIFOXYA2_FULL_42_12 TaxID=1801801 RepID=A0A1F6YQF5_9BACT|nr:MAG: hypothetical protein UV13_C0002G0007 [Parcubacteria group bacterium GW2011_GWC1_42_21]OGJ04889.1 MAG: hypothetical protein A2357_00910 [Candidatus Nomurabacteria bacterium RIFOXYB1_FULL_43_14]OGJ08510.1 MAG: hypothetical protein A2225_02005 [Candidatus Nomurabacteria bacterium RIFOXYA2_FULL_42_12]OGJ10070.1 MAG: hypothetical protein A2443_02470 [Candidatus Nomurabacteria bacterium RIFOXYC2_FULL_43_16]OGJ13736.1 MAG: hypothetical protein A2587_02500 [Candidatus Nomurabacteria bacterium R